MSSSSKRVDNYELVTFENHLHFSVEKKIVYDFSDCQNNKRLAKFLFFDARLSQQVWY